MLNCKEHGYYFSCTPHVPGACRRTSEDEKWSTWAFHKLFGHDPFQLPPTRIAFWRNLCGDFFKRQMTFFLFLGYVMHLKNSLLTQEHRLIITTPSYDTIIQFNCWKKKFWSIFCKEERPLHWALVNCPKVKMTHFFKKSQNSEKLSKMVRKTSQRTAEGHTSPN